MRNLIKNRYIAYLVLHALYFLQALLSLVSRILSFDYSQIKKLGFIQNKKNIFIMLTILYAGFIFYLSSQSDINIPSSIFKIPILYELADIATYLNMDFLIDIAKYAYGNIDKVAHIVLYFGLGLLLHLTFKNSDNIILRRYAAIFAVLLGVIYGITDEYHQSFVPGRTASLHDLLANGIGVTIAQILFAILVIVNLQRKKRKDDQE
ncbi:MAG: VanZ family protein [Methanolobus sp.]|nr:VanZ family protein [Methanolobus sp.]